MNPFEIENDSEKIEKDFKATSWAEVGNNIYRSVGKTTSVLSSGAWRAAVGRDGPMFIKQNVVTDDLLLTPDSLENEIFGEIQTFWTKSENFKKLGFLHRRGIILHGPPGTGKTSLIHLIAQKTLANDGMVFYIGDPDDAKTCLKHFRAIEPTRPIICIYEEIESLINCYGESSILSLLDGEDQINHCVNIATTNFLKKLDGRITNRPKRFDRIY